MSQIFHYFLGGHKDFSGQYMIGPNSKETKWGLFIYLLIIIFLRKMKILSDCHHFPLKK